jgi:Uma2 family endonuclease
MTKEICKMAINPQSQKMTVDEYFQLDSDPTHKYEYIDGYAVAMSGGTVAHEWIAKNVIQGLDRQLRPGSCRTHTSDMRVFIPANGKGYVFPDITVSCEASDNQIETQALRSPRLIVEVLSPSTEAFDRGYKFLLYQTLSSLQEYVLISSRFQFVEIFRRQPDGSWSYHPYRSCQSVKLECLGIELSFEEIYESVPVPVKPELLM